MFLKNKYVSILAAMFVWQVMSIANTNAESPGYASDIITWMINNPGSSQDYKKSLFETMKSSQSRRLAKTARTPSDSEMFKMLYDTRVGVPDNLTDALLSWFAEKNGKYIVQDAKKNIKKATLTELRALSNYPPIVVSALVEVTARPWYDVGTKPWGAWTTTWASMSYWQIFHDVRVVEMAKRSVIIRLMADDGKFALPDKTTVYYWWSGSPSVDIDLSFKHWSRSDITELRRITNNPYFGALATMKMRELYALKK